MLIEESCGLTKSFSKSDSDMSEYMVMPSSAAHSTRASSHTKNVKFMCAQCLHARSSHFHTHPLSHHTTGNVASRLQTLHKAKVTCCPSKSIVLADILHLFHPSKPSDHVARGVSSSHRDQVACRDIAPTENKHINIDKMQTTMVQSAFTARLPQRCPAHNAERLRARAALRSSRAHRTVAAAKPKACSLLQTAAWVG